MDGVPVVLHVSVHNFIGVYKVGLCNQRSPIENTEVYRIVVLATYLQVVIRRQLIVRAWPYVR